MEKTIEQLEKDVIEAIQTCYDPEIPVNIYELGLIYEININEENAVHVMMTLTSPSCPVAETLPPELRNCGIGYAAGMPHGYAAHPFMKW